MHELLILRVECLRMSQYRLETTCPVCGSDRVEASEMQGENFEIRCRKCGAYTAIEHPCVNGRNRLEISWAGREVRPRGLYAEIVEHLTCVWLQGYNPNKPELNACSKCGGSGEYFTNPNNPDEHRIVCSNNKRHDTPPFPTMKEAADYWNEHND